MARFTTAGGEGSGAPGPQGPQGPAGQDAVLPQDLGTTDSPTFSKITLTNNGTTDNITIGDDAYVGDGNIANHIVIVGQQDALEGGIVLGERLTEKVSSNGTDLSLTADNDIILNPGSNYAYIGTPQLDGSNRIAKMSDITGGQGADTGDFVFTAGTATVNDDETLVIQSNSTTAVRSQMTLNPSLGSAKLEAFDSPNVTTFYASNPDWDSATWAVEPGVGSVINFVNAPNILNWIGSSTTSVYSMTVAVNETTSGTVNGFSYNGTDVTIFLNSIVPTEDPTVNQISFSFAVSSRIDIDYDNGSFDLIANNMDIRLTSDDDIYITAGGDDLFLRANDDIRFVARYNEPDLSEQQWTMNSEGQLHFPGSGYISNPVSSSGDGFGNDTIELIPDQNLSVDQRIIIDPTAPNHIHIRAGGIQDESQAYLILGGERTHVQVSDQQGDVRIKTKLSDITYSLQNVNQESSNLLVVDGEFAFDWNWFVYHNGTKYSANGYYTQNGQTFITQYDIPFETGGYYIIGYARGENDWNFSSDGSLYGPGESSVVKVTGIENATDSNSLSVTSSGTMTVTAAGGDMNFWMDGGMYIGESDSNNQIIKRSDLNSFPNSMFQQVRYSPTFSATGLTFTGSDTTYPTYNSYYIKAGQMVSFVIEVDLSTVTNFGTGQYKLELPVDPAFGYNHFTGWANVDTAVNPDVTDGHVVLNVDHAGITSTLDLHYLKQAGGAHTPIVEGLFMQGTPVTLTTSSKIYVNGTYISA